MQTDFCDILCFVELNSSGGGNTATSFMMTQEASDTISDQRVPLPAQSSWTKKSCAETILACLKFKHNALQDKGYMTEWPAHQQNLPKAAQYTDFPKETKNQEARRQSIKCKCNLQYFFFSNQFNLKPIFQTVIVMQWNEKLWSGINQGTKYKTTSNCQIYWLYLNEWIWTWIPSPIIPIFLHQRVSLFKGKKICFSTPPNSSHYEMLEII